MEDNRKPTVLFVDDEPNILQGLQRMLRSERDTLDMQFAGGSVEALTILENTQFDMIVTDMRMPVMNGAELLDEIRIRYPATIRIALSGHTDQEFIFQAVRSTHQFLAKPCDAQLLKDTLNSCLHLRDLVESQSLRSVICSIQSIPSMPSAFDALQDALQWGESSVARIGKIVASDMGMSAKCMQLVNSAFFGTPQGACTAEQAVIQLGVEALRELYRSPEVCSLFPIDLNDNLALEEMWAHSMLTGMIGRRIAEFEELPPREVDATFVAAFLHDVGKLILASEQPAVYDTLPDWSGEAARNMESIVLGASHESVGAYLLGLWGFDHEIVEAVAFHHRPRCSTMGHSKPLTIVHAANVISHENSTVTKTADIDMDYVTSAGMSGHYDDWHRLAADIMMNGVYR
ncbi:MAG TPA: HDOD domain-containing protein [Capsulimonadaceae bacterium]|jgi:HD-like signal output (HDOD) protein/CheY-like chemotaxis protein